MAQSSQGNVIDLPKRSFACSHCCLEQLCEPCDAPGPMMERLEPIVRHRLPLRRGDTLFNAGDAFSALYLIYSGTVKTFTFTRDGNEQITGFHLPGGLVGIDGIHRGIHWSSAVALDKSSVCEIPFEKLEALAQQVPGLLHQLLSAISREILQDVATMQLLGKKAAEERLASLLLSLTTRFRERGYSAQEINLPMSRDDIANYLGMAHETVSRLFSRFQRQGLLAVKGKHLWIRDFDKLRTLAGMTIEAERGDSKDLSPLSG